MKVILTEKPSVAKDIAAHLGAKNRHEGYFEGNGVQVTWAFGHLIALKDPEEYDPALKKWSLETIPFIPKSFELKVVDDPGIRKQFGVIKKLMKGCSEIICATDAGREGELIFRYILSMTECTHKPWKRLWLSSLTDEAIKAAFLQLKNGAEYNNLYAAARCRSESDWIVGLNATRNYTVRFGGKILWSVGRVQTPVLAMIVRRDDEIRHFKVEIFWELFTTYRDVAFKLEKIRFKTKEEACALLEKIKGHPFTIEKVTSKKENEHPPLLFDLTELQREMNKKWGLSAADTLQIAQTLYEQKLITYPRTDSRYLTKDLKGQVVETLQQLQTIRPQEIGQLSLKDLPFSNRIVNDKKVSDHHAILPTGKIPGALSGPSQSVFDAILTRLIAAFYPTCVKKSTVVEGVTGGETFIAKGVVILDPGWRVLYPKKEKEKEEEEEQVLPEFKQGEWGPHEPFFKEGKTKPAPHFTENALLGAMETAGKLIEDETLKEALKEKGIGTPATRAAIIETLIKRNYIERSGKSLKATHLGRYLIALIQDPNLKSAELTGEWEFKLKQMEQGLVQPQEFMEHIARFTHQVIQGSDLGRINYEMLGPCPKCGSAVMRGKKGYGCSKWKEGCTFAVIKDLSENQIRSLLQKKILLQPIEEMILSLSDNGDLNEIPVPKQEGNRPNALTKRGRKSTKERKYGKKA